MGITDKVKQLTSQVSGHHETAKSLATVINDKLPEDKKLAVPELDKNASVKENTSKLVTFIQNLDDFVLELDKTLKENLSPEQYAKVSNVTTTIEEALAISKVVAKGLVLIVCPIVTAIVAKIKSSNILQRLKMKLEGINKSEVVNAVHDSVTKKGHVDEAHPGIKENEHQLDEAIKALGPEEDKDTPDFATTVKGLVAWHKKADSK